MAAGHRTASYDLVHVRKGSTPSFDYSPTLPQLYRLEPLTMTDYFSEYSSFVGAKGLPSPADTPYETPDLIRSKRNSRVTSSSRDHSATPPLPPDPNDHQDGKRDGRYSGVDPRRFTPTLHASLVSEILNLRRELDSKNHLVENLETSLSVTKGENDTLNEQLAESTKEARKARQAVEQIEKGTYDAVEVLAQERDAAVVALRDLRAKFDNAQKKTRQLDDDAVRTQSIWENEKESWDNERRQLERRVHVTETRLRAVVDEMAAQQAQTIQIEESTDDATFKDSGLGDGSDTASIRTASPVKHKHKRNASSISFRPRTHTRGSTSSRGDAPTPDLYARDGNTLADELVDEEDEDEFEDVEEEVGTTESTKSRQGSVSEDYEDAKTTTALGPISESLQSAILGRSNDVGNVQANRPQYHDRATTPPPFFQTPQAPPKKVVYVDTGYQPSPPVSPPKVQVTAATADASDPAEAFADSHVRTPAINTDATLADTTPKLRTQVTASPLSPPQTPVVDGATWLERKMAPSVAPLYSTASTQTDLVEPERPAGYTPKRDSLSPPQFVPSIAIHPPHSRPSSPRTYVLPPGTKNAACQASVGWPCKDASVQTEEIRIDRRPVKLRPHLLQGTLLPSPSFQEPLQPRRSVVGEGARISIKVPTPPAAVVGPSSPTVQSPSESSPEMSRTNSSKDLRNYPLKALPLPRPVLSPVLSQGETFQSNGPLNRSSQYGVSQTKWENQPIVDNESWSGPSEDEDEGEFDISEIVESVPMPSRPPPGRFGLSEPPKAVPEDKEISPERRPDTADSYGAAPAPSVSSSRSASQPRSARQTSKTKLGRTDVRRDLRSRSPSFGSMASSAQSAPTGLPPYPIPARSSSRVSGPRARSNGAQSPTRNERSTRSQHARQSSLRKVQSAAVIRNRNGRGSPSKPHRRRRRSPQLTPVQSMALDSPTGPTPTKFPIPELPTPLQDSLTFDYIKGSVDMNRSPGTASTATWNVPEESGLVDAIAATMVGEWMWKYIRKRKSFGIGEDSSEFPVADQHGIVNMTTGHGTRHKRWVWLSPYERTIMWDNKQPTSGPALLGKKGRKLAIQSVLDVEDQTPLAKSPELSTAFNRSILILTPERALKFTATNEERHCLWMTALSFLAEPSQLPTQIPQQLRPKTDDVPPVPPIPLNPSIDGVPIKRHRSPSFGRATVRDSIRLAKGKRPDVQTRLSQLHPERYAYGSGAHSSEMMVNDISAHQEDDSADFPAVPRLYSSTTRHQRKRSNTSPRLPESLTPSTTTTNASNNRRSVSSSAMGSAFAYHPHGNSTQGSSYRPSASSKSGSISQQISPTGHNFFEAVGTVRMEAFVDPNVRDGVLYVPAPPPAATAVPRRHRRGSNLSQSTVDKRRAGYVFDEDGMDPFKGF